MMAETTTTLNNIKNFEDKAAGNVILADHINEVQDEIEKIETELLGEADSSGKSRLDKLEKELANLKEQISKLAGTLAESGGGLLTNKQGDKLKVARASTSSPGIVKLVDTSFTNTKDYNDAVTWGAFADVFEKKILQENGQLPSKYIPSDLMSSFVFAGVVTFEEKNGVITFDKEKLGIEDETVTSCYYLAKVIPKVSTDDQGVKLIYTIEGTCKALWSDDSVIISDGSWIQGSRDSGESDWEWFIIDRAKKVVIQVSENTYTEDERGITDLSGPFGDMQADINGVKTSMNQIESSVEKKLASYHPYYVGILVTKPIRLLQPDLRFYDYDKLIFPEQDFRLKLPGGQKDFKKMRWWSQHEATPFFEAYQAERQDDSEAAITYFRQGVDGSGDHIYLKHLSGWNHANESWPAYRGGYLFGEFRNILLNGRLEWNENDQLWELCFTLTRMYRGDEFESEGETIYYEFYN